jgi:AraC-like DNA-binding protein
MQVGMTVQYDDRKGLMFDATGQMSPMAYRAVQPGKHAGAAPELAASLTDVAALRTDGPRVSPEAPEGADAAAAGAATIGPVDAAATSAAAVTAAAGISGGAISIASERALSTEPRDAVSVPLSAEGGSLLSEVVAISTASSALPSCADADQMLRVATELARDIIGLSRVAFYIRDPSAERLLFRGSWATQADGSTRSDHDAVRELAVRDGLALQNLRESGSPSLCRARSAWFVSSGPEPIGDDDSIMVTPLFAAGHLVGMLCNDAPRGQLPEPSKQAAAAVLCGMVAIDYVARRGPVRFQPLGVATAPSQLVQRIRDAIDENPARRGKDLAVEFGVSPGHLARAFKREMGLSLVDYRNRKRIDRFWDTLRRRGRAYSLKQAAFDAGFGSYAQFNRIHKKLVGVGPRLGARRTEAAPFEAQDGADAAS